MRTVIGTFTIAALVAAGASADTAKTKKPRLELRATPRMAISPVVVLMTAELQGGSEAGEYYCPELEWDWDDGSRSVRESDCAPPEEGGTLERRYTASHAYRRAGVYTVKVTMRRSGRSIAMATTSINVQPGAGDLAAGN
jgi:PKD repeat protein